MNENYSLAISHALEIISSRVDAIRTGPDNKVTLDNISQYDSGNNDFADKVVCSLINIEEEATLRNGRVSTRSATEDDKVFRHNPPEIFNLYVLFSATHSEYREAMKDISRVASFFQQNLVFNRDNEATLNEALEAVGASIPISLQEANIKKIIFELHTLSIEQLNHLWGVLGGKYFPSLLYKCRLVELLNIPDQPSTVIRAVQRDEKNLLS